MMAPPAPAQRRMPPKGMPLPSMPPGYKPPVRPGPPGRLGPPNTMPPRGMPPGPGNTPPGMSPIVKPAPNQTDPRTGKPFVAGRRVSPPEPPVRRGPVGPGNHHPRLEMPPTPPSTPAQIAARRAEWIKQNPSQADRDWDAPKSTPPLGSKMPARKKKQPAKWPAPPVARGRVTADRLSASY